MPEVETFIMELIDYVMVVCATWYISFILTTLPGPRNIFAIMRAWRGNGVMRCIYCLSLWVGGVLYLFAYLGYTDIVSVFGVVGAAHILAAYTGANYGQGGS